MINVKNVFDIYITMNLIKQRLMIANDFECLLSTFEYNDTNRIILEIQVSLILDFIREHNAEFLFDHPRFGRIIDEQYDELECFRALENL